MIGYLFIDSSIRDNDVYSTNYLKLRNTLLIYLGTKPECTKDSFSHNFIFKNK